MRVKLNLYGIFRDRIGKNSVVVQANSIYDAIKGFDSVYREKLHPVMDLGKWNFKIKEVECEAELHRTLTEDTEINLFPTFKTSKSRAASQITLAVVQLAVAYYAGGSGVSESGGVEWNGYATDEAGKIVSTSSGSWVQPEHSLSSSLAVSGAINLASGIFNLFCSSPTRNTKQEKSLTSMYLGATRNTVAAKTRIPFGYGKFKVSGHYISFNISSARVIIAS